MMNNIELDILVKTFNRFSPIIILLLKIITYEYP